MFKPELWQSHDGYETIVNAYGRRLFHNNSKYAFDLCDKESKKLLNFNLDAVMEIPRFYSDSGRLVKTRNNSCVPSSFLYYFFSDFPRLHINIFWISIAS